MDKCLLPWIELKKTNDKLMHMTQPVLLTCSCTSAKLEHGRVFAFIAVRRTTRHEVSILYSVPKPKGVPDG